MNCPEASLDLYGPQRLCDNYGAYNSKGGGGRARQSRRRARREASNEGKRGARRRTKGSASLRGSAAPAFPQILPPKGWCSRTPV